MLLGRLAALSGGLVQISGDVGCQYLNPLWSTAAEGCSHWQSILQQGTKDLLRVRKQEDAAPTIMRSDLGCIGLSQHQRDLQAETCQIVVAYLVAQALWTAASTACLGKHAAVALRPNPH